MPSPFPGMDPYLEAPEHWHNVHHALIGEIYRRLNADLPEGFAAEIEEKVYVVRPEGYYPDVAVTRFAVAPNRPASIATSRVLTQERPLRIEVPLEEIRLPYIEIVTTGSPEQVVTAIEVLSPVNKRGEGRTQYIRKRNRVLKSKTHLLEMDLLRGGEHSVGVPERELRLETSWDYLVCLHRAEQGAFDCWPISVRDPLPEVAIPLTEDQPDFLISLQTAFHRVYDEGPFRRKVHYENDPTPRLELVDRVWANALLQARVLPS